MNTETGAVYRGDELIRAAQVRGEPIVPVSEHLAGLSRADRVRVGNVIAQLKRIRPHLSDEEREAEALKMCRR